MRKKREAVSKEAASLFLYADKKGRREASFRRCRLRGKDKVSIEIGLISLAHNLQKMTIAQKRKGIGPFQKIDQTQHYLTL